LSKDWVKDIEELHDEVFLTRHDEGKNYPHIPSESIKDLRWNLVAEEIAETFKALKEDDLVELADGLADSIVVLIGLAVTYGIDLRPVWDEVHFSNLAKKGGPIRADGKRLKPEGWKPPDIKSIIDNQIKLKK
jgi:predicted HAD superfamily Cof-like phosphohydrolase